MNKQSITRITAFILMSCLGAAKAERSPYGIYDLSLLPHQVGICDVIFAGTVLSTNFDDRTASFPYYELPAAEFAVDDVVWGSVSSSNITVKSLYPAGGFHFMPNERYLVCAFTTNWWAIQTRDDYDYLRLYHYFSITSRPPENAVFDDYRIMYPPYTTIPFSLINHNGSNYWTSTRALVTNLVEIARIRGDEQMMRLTITNLVNAKAGSGLPPIVWKHLLMYKEDRYDCVDIFDKERLQSP